MLKQTKITDFFKSSNSGNQNILSMVKNLQINVKK